MDNDNLDRMQSRISPEIEIEDNITSYKLDCVPFPPKQNSFHSDNEMGLDDNSVDTEENSSHPDNDLGVDNSSVGPDIELPLSHGVITFPDYVPQSIHSLPKILPYTVYVVSAQFYDDLFAMDQVESVPVGKSYVNIVASRIKDFAPDAQSVLTLVARELDSVEHHLVNNQKRFEESGLMDRSIGKSVPKQCFDLLPRFALTQLLDRLLWANKPGSYSRPNTKSYLHPNLGLDDVTSMKFNNSQEFFTWTNSRMDSAIRHFYDLCGGLQQKVNWKPNAVEHISQSKETLDDIRFVDSERSYQQVAESSNLVLYGQHVSMENTVDFHQSQYASHLHGIVSAFQHGSIADIHLIFSNLWHIATSAFVLFNFDNTHYIKALQTALSNMDMHEKVALHVLDYLQESIASPHKAVAPILTALAYSPVFALEPGLSVRNKRHSMRDFTASKILMHSFKNPIATKDRHLQVERAIWRCLTDMLASLNMMAKVNLSDTYSQTVSFQLAPYG
ncbi:hypothetical protein M422DRAFT_272319 [Sphaerobolus stellatus SS14]|uniref:Uncharacterized protein n=1 Tax=Sphaerobolus stellatus (strain SS14) TaxID=990650 RepID=A0A0C9UM94_SPHS4|nr:hypothetical protein M422DRAFT_272319 [Sphaerobolus stellatus SS14]